MTFEFILNSSAPVVFLLRCWDESGSRTTAIYGRQLMHPERGARRVRTFPFNSWLVDEIHVPRDLMQVKSLPKELAEILPTVPALCDANVLHRLCLLRCTRSVISIAHWLPYQNGFQFRWREFLENPTYDSMSRLTIRTRGREKCNDSNLLAGSIELLAHVLGAQWRHRPGRGRCQRARAPGFCNRRMTAILTGSRGSSHPSKTEKHGRDKQNGRGFSHGLLHILRQPSMTAVCSVLSTAILKTWLLQGTCVGTSVHSERNHWIDLGRPPSREIAGHQRNPE